MSHAKPVRSVQPRVSQTRATPSPLTATSEPPSGEKATSFAWRPPSVRLAFRSPVRLRVQVRNVLDRLYVLGGEGDQFFPAATRNAFAAVEFGW